MIRLLQRAQSASIVVLALALAVLAPIIAVADVAATSQQSSSPSIQVTKRQCEGRDTFPVFVESHCEEVPDATFEIKDPRDIHIETVPAGSSYEPDDWYFNGSNLWRITDVSPNASAQGASVMSCVAYEPGSDWHSSVKRVVQAEGSRSVLLDWMFVATGVPRASYQPSFDCIWLELPDIETVPAVLSLQVYTSETPYLSWTELTGSPLPDVARGESGDDLEAHMVLTNITTGEVYSFAADDYGQVLVPAGTYSLVESANGLEEFFTMVAGQTTLVEIGLAAPGQGSGTGQQMDTGVFATGAVYCEGTNCSPLGGVTVYYESIDGALSGSCVTEVQQTPNGAGSWCEYPFVRGIPTVLTLDESSLPPGMVVTSDNPVTYLVPENPDGPLGPVFFVVGPS